MNELLLSETDKASVEQFIRHPSHALLIVGPVGSGKRTIAHYIAAQLLNIEPQNIQVNSYFKRIDHQTYKTISIDAIREIIHFATLKTLGVPGQRRVVLIEDAQTMTAQAQNALLKTIEEPPMGMVIILTSQHEQAVLPTIRSRTQLITLHQPRSQDMTAYFIAKGYEESIIAKTLLMSGGLVGLTAALLSEADHPLLAAAATARDILQKSTYERLLQVDALSKQPELWRDTLTVMERMAEVALQQHTSSNTMRQRWRNVLRACYDTQSYLQRNVQLKLAVLHFMLTL